MLNELINWEKGSTIFKGKFFDKLRMLAKLEGEPNLKAAIVSILKHFDCYVHQRNSLKAIVMQAQNLAICCPKEKLLRLGNNRVIESIIRAI